VFHPIKVRENNDKKNNQPIHSYNVAISKFVSKNHLCIYELSN